MKISRVPVLISALLAVFAATTLVVGPVFAADKTDQEIMLSVHGKKISANEYWMTLSSDQQAAAKAQAKGKFQQISARAQQVWSQMTPEEQQNALLAAKAQGTEAVQRTRAAYQGLTPEQQQQMKDENTELSQRRRAARQAEKAAESE